MQLDANDAHGLEARVAPDLTAGHFSCVSGRVHQLHNLWVDRQNRYRSDRRAVGAFHPGAAPPPARASTKRLRMSMLQVVEIPKVNRSTPYQSSVKPSG